MYGRIGLVLVALVAALVWFLPSYYTGLLTQIGLYALVTIGLNLFMGYAGQVSLGHAAFFGIGAYTSAALAVKAHVTPWAGMIAGAIVAALIAYALSFVALRLRENLLALATLALGIVINVVFNQWEFIGGSSGFKDIPPFAIGSGENRCVLRYLPTISPLASITIWLLKMHSSARSETPQMIPSDKRFAAARSSGTAPCVQRDPAPAARETTPTAPLESRLRPRSR